MQAMGLAGVIRGKPVRTTFSDSYENASEETVNGLYKPEVIYRRGPWRSFEAVEYATLGWAGWFDHRRLIETIANIPPAEAEEQHGAAMNIVDVAA